jgi:hypothetical protein
MLRLASFFLWLDSSRDSSLKTALHRLRLRDVVTLVSRSRQVHRITAREDSSCGMKSRHHASHAF